MSHGLLKVYTATIASGATTSTAINLQRIYANAYVEVPTMSTQAAIYVLTTYASGATYFKMYHPPVNSSTVSCHVFAITTQTSGGYVPLPAGIQFIKFETTATVTNGVSFKVLCSDS